MSEIATRRIYYLAAVAIVAIVLISVVASTRPLTVQTANTPEVKTLQVTGQGTVSAVPDQALLLLAVQTQATSANDASTNNAAIMSKVIDALANIGIGKDAIQTVSYSLTPMYENKPDQTVPPTIVGYMVRNAIQVTVNDLGKVGSVLDTAVTAGVNEVQSVEFTLTQASYANIEKQALQLAIQDADAKAKAVATTLGVSLLGPISVTPGYTFQPVFERLAASSVGTPIEPGPLQVTANAQITYQIA